MKKIMCIAAALLLSSCGNVKYIPVEHTEYVTVRDTTYIKADTVKIDVPVEVVKEVVPAVEELRMETSLASARAWLDTATVTLKGELKNKKATLKKEVLYKERTVYRDSIQYKDKPYPVEVEKIVKHTPWFTKILAWIGAISLLLLVGYIVIKFYKPL